LSGNKKHFVKDKDMIVPSSPTTQESASMKVLARFGIRPTAPTTAPKSARINTVSPQTRPNDLKSAIKSSLVKMQSSFP
jgi:hypothetical protein